MKPPASEGQRKLSNDSMPRPKKTRHSKGVDPAQHDSGKREQVRPESRVYCWQRHLKTGVLEARVLANPNGPHFNRVVQATEIVNSAQTYFKLSLDLDRRGDLLPVGDRARLADPIRRNIQRKFPYELVIGMVEHDLKDEDGSDLTIDEAPGCTIISCADWADYDDPPSMRVYLVYQLTSALISFAGCLSEVENEDLMHGDADDDDDDDDDKEGDTDSSVPQGCLFDYWDESERLFLSMVCARLCDRCRSSLLAHGTPPEAISATERLLEWIRSVVLGRERLLPQKVFIGHGRKPDWEKLKAMLEKWNLAVEEFNEVPAAGVSITQRLKAMLDQSRFAFLVMTGEDMVSSAVDKGKAAQLQARMNVIHEIGLFQGRLGTEYAVVLRERGAEVFSNLDGINRLDYELGRISELEPEIHRLLIARGVMPANTPSSGAPMA